MKKILILTILLLFSSFAFAVFDSSKVEYLDVDLEEKEVFFDYGIMEYGFGFDFSWVADHQDTSDYKPNKDSYCNYQCQGDLPGILKERYKYAQGSMERALSDCSAGKADKYGWAIETFPCESMSEEEYDQFEPFSWCSRIMLTRILKKEWKLFIGGYGYVPAIESDSFGETWESNSLVTDEEVYQLNETREQIYQELKIIEDECFFSDKECNNKAVKPYCKAFTQAEMDALAKAYPRTLKYWENKSKQCIEACNFAYAQIEGGSISAEMELSKNSLMADGSDYLDITISVSNEEGALSDESVIFSVTTENKEWETFLGLPSPASGTTNSNGYFSATFSSEFFYEMAKTMEKELEEPFIATITASVGAGESVSQTIIIEPAASIKIKIIEPVQALKNAALVSGKKMVVFVGINAEDKTYFEENDGVKYFLEFEASGYPATSFTPESFPAFDLSKPTNNSEVVRVEDVEKHIDFFIATGNEWLSQEGNELVNLDNFSLESEGELQGPVLDILGNQLEEAKDESTWLFYEFYLDPNYSVDSGEYSFTASIYKEDSSSGTTKQTYFDDETVTYKVYPSPTFRVLIMPVGIGLWKDDFCEYCVIEDPNYMPSSKFFDTWGNGITISYSKRHRGKAAELEEKFNFNCLTSMFTLTFDRVVDQKRIDAVLNKDDSDMRQYCKQKFNEILPPETLAKRIAKSPLVQGNEKTDQQDYLETAREHAKYLRATIPVAEERLVIDILEDPVNIPGIHGASDSLFSILSKMKNKPWPKPNYYDRVIAFAPNLINTSNLEFSGLFGEGIMGYMNGLANEEAILVAHEAFDNVGVHEIAHTYCAIDEYTIGVNRARQSAIQLLPNACEGFWWRINSREGEDERGTPVHHGYDVDARKFMGTFSDPGYSYMGKCEKCEDKKWVTNDLYYGLGVRLGTYPSLEDAENGKVE